jgi:hypothetical protein
MDEESTKSNRPKKTKLEVNQKIEENRQNSDTVDTSIFDKTLKEIDQILIILKQKIEVDRGALKNFNPLPEIQSAVSKIKLAKNELIKEENKVIENNDLLKRIEYLEKNINNSSDKILLSNDLSAETTNEIKEHEIDKNILSINEIHDFENNYEKKKKKSVGFYSYLVFIIVTLITFYGVLNISKDLIILKYPFTELYINYFFEIINILKITIFGLFIFFKNII